MTELTSGILIGSVPACITAAISVIVVYLTNRDSRRAFYRQRWWDLQIEEYGKTVRELSLLRFTLGEWIDDLGGVRPIPTPSKEAMLDELREVRKSLHAASAAGAFILSESSVEAVRRVVRELDDATANVFADIERQHEAVGAAIATLRSEARMELRPDQAVWVAKVKAHLPLGRPTSSGPT